MILGASFAGLELLYQLQRSGYFQQDPPGRIVVIDKCAASSYIPLIHEALCGPEGAPAALRFQGFLQRLPGVEFCQAQVVQVDFGRRCVHLQDGSILEAHTLVAALGSELRAPAKLDPHARCVALKSQEDKARLRARIDALKGRGQVMVVGGGISGVELVAELAHRGPATLKLDLVHTGEQLLPTLPKRAAHMAQAQLQALGVTLHLRTRVEEVGRTAVQLRSKDGAAQALHPEIVCWAGGVVGPCEVRWVDAQAHPRGWLCVDRHLRVRSATGQAHPGAYAIGDLASIVDPPGQDPWPTMRRAIEAIWQAQTLAKILSAPMPEPNASALSASHRLREQWPYGVSVGPASLVCVGNYAWNLRGVGRWFRRWLERMYLRRYGLTRVS